MNLNVLLVEDEARDRDSYLRDFPAVFMAAGVTANFHTAETFEQAYRIIDTSYIRFDLILSDTYRGQLKDRDAAVVNMVNKYRGGRFCPLVVFSAIQKVLATGIPQLARSLHDELDQSASGFLWKFLETNWDSLWPDGNPDRGVIERLVRRRAALQFAEISESGGESGPVASIAGLEYYIYPPLNKDVLSLGHIIRKRTDHADIRLVLTPHCHLTIQQNKKEPRAEFVLTVKAIPTGQVLGQKIEAARALELPQQDKKLTSWSTPPSRQDVGLPEGRYWYLPGFLNIPHSFCDFQQIESFAYAAIGTNYEPIAVLTPPFAESLQSCFLSYHSGVGIPSIKPDTIRSLLA